jgi:hypothetical protein
MKTIYPALKLHALTPRLNNLSGDPEAGDRRDDEDFS